MDNGSILIDEQFLPAAYELLERPQKLICISAFKAEIICRPRGRKLLNFFELVFEKSRLGVDVRFLINRVTKIGSVPLSNLSAIPEIMKHGIKVRCLRNDRCCHAKMILSDNYGAILGSHNLSVKSVSSNFEVSYLFKDEPTVRTLQGIFDRVWENSQEV